MTAALIGACTVCFHYEISANCDTRTGRHWLVHKYLDMMYGLQNLIFFPLLDFFLVVRGGRVEIESFTHKNPLKNDLIE